MLPSAAELEYFIEVSNSLNFSQAANRLGLSQPSLSLAMKRLESCLGTILFIRHKQGVSLTQAGQRLLLNARQLLQYWEKTRFEVLESQKSVQGYVSLGCPTTIAIYLVSEFLPSLLEEHPKLELKLIHDISRKITEKVINLSIDLGIVVNPLKHPDLIIHKLATDEVTFWIASNKELKDLSSQVPIICQPNLIQARTLLKKIKESGFNFKRIITTNSLEVIAKLTAEGCGIGILPTRFIKSAYLEQLKTIPDMPSYFDHICLIYRDENRHVLAVRAIIDRIKSMA